MPPWCGVKIPRFAASPFAARRVSPSRRPRARHRPAAPGGKGGAAAPGPASSAACVPRSPAAPPSQRVRAVAAPPARPLRPPPGCRSSSFPRRLRRAPRGASSQQPRPALAVPPGICRAGSDAGSAVPGSGPCPGGKRRGRGGSSPLPRQTQPARLPGNFRANSGTALRARRRLSTGSQPQEAACDWRGRLRPRGGNGTDFMPGLGAAAAAGGGGAMIREGVPHPLPPSRPLEPPPHPSQTGEDQERQQHQGARKTQTPAASREQLAQRGDP